MLVRTWDRKKVDVIFLLFAWQITADNATDANANAFAFQSAGEFAEHNASFGVLRPGSFSWHGTTLYQISSMDFPSNSSNTLF